MHLANMVRGADDTWVSGQMPDGRRIKIGDRVRITELSSVFTAHGVSNGMEGVISSLDTDNTPFFVEMPNGTSSWVRSVELLDVEPKTEVSELEARLRAEFAAEKLRISRELLRRAQGHGLCSEVEEALADLGLPTNENCSYLVTLRVNIENGIRSANEPDDVKSEIVTAINNMIRPTLRDSITHIATDNIEA